MKRKINFGAHTKLKEIVEKWRNIIGVDPIYIIHIAESTEEYGQAWIEGLGLQNVHPEVTIFFNSEWLNENKYKEEIITEIIIHELVHIIVYQLIIAIDPNYEYKGMKAFANEVLTMKITEAIMKTKRL